MNNYIDILKEETALSCDEINLVDIINDKVYNYSIASQINLVSENNFMEFVDFINKTFENKDSEELLKCISFQELEKTLYQEKKYISKIVHNITNNKNYLKIIKLINYNNYKLILIMSINLEKDNIINNANKNDDNSKLDLLINVVSESILKIYNTIDIDSNNYIIGYIKNILQQLTNSFPELNKSFESNLISDVNKSKKTVLIVDDDFMTRNLLKKAFQNDYDIIEAENGQIAIDILKDNISLNTVDMKKNIVCIFLDLTMPVLDGFGVLEFLKNNNILTKIPTIVISAAEEKEVRTRTYHYQIADMLEKPFNLDIIKLRTNNFINLYHTSNNLKELVTIKNKKLIDLIVNYINNQSERINKYISLLIRELKNINYLNSNMYVEVLDLALEYDNLITNNIEPYNVIIKEEGIRYSSILINIFKKIFNEFN